MPKISLLLLANGTKRFAGVSVHGVVGVMVCGHDSTQRRKDPKTQRFLQTVYNTKNPILHMTIAKVNK